LFNVFLNPSFVSEYKVDPIIEVILNPLQTEGLRGQLPKIAPTKVRTSKKKVELIAHEALNRKKGFEDLPQAEKQKQIDEFLAKRDIKLKEKSFTVFITGKERSEMQKFMASETDKIFRSIITPGSLKAAPPEEQEKILGRWVNLISNYGKLNLLRMRMDLPIIEFRVEDFNEESE